MVVIRQVTKSRLKRILNYYTIDGKVVFTSERRQIFFKVLPILIMMSVSELHIEFDYLEGFHGNSEAKVRIVLGWVTFLVLDF